MIIILTIIGCIFTGIAAYSTFQIMLQGIKPSIMLERQIINPHYNTIFVTFLYSEYGTFSDIVRNANGEGYISDTGKSKIELNKHLSHIEKYEIPYKFLYINNEPKNYYTELHLDFLRGFNFNCYKVEAIPMGVLKKSKLEIILKKFFKQNNT